MRMPYIWSKKDREKLNKLIEESGSTLSVKGNLNYTIFKFAKEYCKDYEDFRALFGELIMCMFEMYRRLVGPYEDKKIEQNGDVE